MRVDRHPDAASFLAAAGGFLAEREALHNLPLAIAQHCVDDPTRYTRRNYFAVVEEGGRVTGLAMMTPPHRLQFYAPPGAAAAVAADLEEGGWAPPGVHGPEEASAAFAALWSARRGLAGRLDRNLRAFELTEVIPAPQVPGRLRVAVEADLPLAERWYRAFHEDTRTTASGLPPEEVARRTVRAGRHFLWEDGGPVSQAAASGRTPNGARVGSVYTPPDLRRRGYATALVAALSRSLLADGRRFCFLFTDLANPVSNSIYPKIGYRPVADFRDFDFG